MRTPALGFALFLLALALCLLPRPGPPPPEPAAPPSARLLRAQAQPDSPNQAPEPAFSGAAPGGAKAAATSDGHAWGSLRALFDERARPAPSEAADTPVERARALSPGGSARTVAAARRLPDGRIVTACFESFATLEGFLRDHASDADCGHRHADQAPLLKR